MNLLLCIFFILIGCEIKVTPCRTQARSREEGIQVDRLGAKIMRAQFFYDLCSIIVHISSSSKKQRKKTK